VSSQTFQQRRAIRAYCAHQRSEHRASTTGQVVPFPTAPGVPGSQPQPFGWAHSWPFLVAALFVAAAVFASVKAGAL
jgi:hypothetical protein